MEYSASDYQYTQRPPRRILSRQQQLAQSRRSHGRSRFSILSDDHPGPRGSYHEHSQTAATVESYDPYRSSRNHIQEVQADHANITVLRPGSRHSTIRTGSLRHPAVARLSEALSPRTPDSVVASSRGRTSFEQGYASSARNGSRYSLASTGYRSSPPIIVRPSSSHKRAVTFNHVRKPSGTSAWIRSREGATSRNEERRDVASKYGSSPPTTICELPSSPVMDDRAIVRSRKDTVAVAPSAPAVGSGRTAQSHMFREEARKVSNELGKFCEEAFNSVRPSAAKPPNAFESSTHPTSSFQANSRSSAAVVGIEGSKEARLKALLQDRPLPPVPVRSRDSFTEEQLQLTRDRLQRRSAQGEAGASQGYLDDVIAHLDRLMQPSTLTAGEYHDNGGGGGRRVASSTADCKSPPPAPLSRRLPAITEEGDRPVDYEHGYRVTSAPIIQWSHREHGIDPRDTIRMVGDGGVAPPMAPVAPLNVRKRSERVVQARLMEDSSERDDDKKKGKSMTSGHGKKLRWFKRGSEDKENHNGGVKLEEEETDKRRLSGGGGSGRKGFFNIFHRRESGKQTTEGEVEVRLGGECDVFLDGL